MAASIKQFPPIGVPPGVWGPIFWHTMHLVTLGYPQNPSDDEKAAVSNFFNSLAYLIPCPLCREHYRQNLAEYPVDDALNSRDDLIVWCFTMHNKVNVQLGKRELPWDEFIKHIMILAKKDKLNLEQCGEHTAGGSTAMPLALGMSVGMAAGIAAYVLYQKYK